MKSTDVGQKLVIPEPFANDGDRREFGNNEAANVANFPKGIPSIYSLDMRLGGKHAERQDINGIGYMATQPYFMLQNGQLTMFDSRVAEAIGGYPQGACLWYRPNQNHLVIVESQLDDNSVAPTANTVDVKSNAQGEIDLVNGLVRWVSVNYKTDYLPLTGGNLTGNASILNENIVRSVNNAFADTNGNVTLSIPSVSGMVRSVNGNYPDYRGCVTIDISQPYGGGEVISRNSGVFNAAATSTTQTIYTASENCYLSVYAGKGDITNNNELQITINSNIVTFTRDENQDEFARHISWSGLVKKSDVVKIVSTGSTTSSYYIIRWSYTANKIRN